MIAPFLLLSSTTITLTIQVHDTWQISSADWQKRAQQNSKWMGTSYREVKIVMIVWAKQHGKWMHEHPVTHATTLNKADLHLTVD